MVGCSVCATGGDQEPSHDRRASARISIPAALRLAGGIGRVSRFRVPVRGRRPIVFEPSWVLVCDENDRLQLLRDHSVVVEDDTIVAITPGHKSGRERRVRATGRLLVPGFISGHTHVAAGSVTRGIIEGGRSYLRPLQLADALSAGDMDDLTAYNLAELLRSGCTTQVEMSMSLKQAESYVRLAERWGVRGYPSGMVPGVHRLAEVWARSDDQVLYDSVPDSLAEIAANLEFGRRHNGASEGRILPQMGPHATDTQTPETMAAFSEAARELGNGIHLHMSQSANETETVERLWGKRPAEWIDDFGFYEGPLFAAHMTGADLGLDPGVLREHGAVYVHNPSAGGAGGATQPWPEFLGAGTLTNIGIDTHSNDYLENLKLAVLYGRVRHSLVSDLARGELVRPTIWDAMRAATVNAANGLGRSDIGRISVGAKADLVTIDVQGLLTGTGAVPPEPLNNLLYGHGGFVRDVMTDGTFQVWDGRLVIDDERRVVQRGAEVVEQVWGQLRSEGWFTPT